MSKIILTKESKQKLKALAEKYKCKVEPMWEEIGSILIGAKPGKKSTFNNLFAYETKEKITDFIEERYEEASEIVALIKYLKSSNTKDSKEAQEGAMIYLKKLVSNLDIMEKLMFKNIKDPLRGNDYFHNVKFEGRLNRAKRNFQRSLKKDYSDLSVEDEKSRTINFANHVGGIYKLPFYGKLIDRGLNAKKYGINAFEYLTMLQSTTISR